MNSPEEISVGQKNSGADNVSHEYYVVHARDRYTALKRIVDLHPSIYGIIFCRTRIETKEVADRLMQDGYNADALHGDLSQSQRDYVMNRFRNKSLQLLVATDVAARGIDVQDLTHIINYNLPDDPEVYLHRTGRTGRAGKNGIAISLIHTRESGRIKDIERMIKKSLDRKKVPGGKEICETQLLTLVDKVENTVVDNENIAKYLPAIVEKLAWLDREELIKRFISVEFNRFLEYYKNAPDLNVVLNDKQVTSKQSRPESFARLHINLGAKQNLTAGSLMSLINRNCRGNRITFGKIEILRKFSFFEIEESRMKSLLTGMNNVLFDGIPVKVELSSPAAPEYAVNNGERKKDHRHDNHKSNKKRK
jgi:ATP-dependent RNA helicase DeaD